MAGATGAVRLATSEDSTPELASLVRTDRKLGAKASRYMGWVIGFVIGLLVSIVSAVFFALRRRRMLRNQQASVPMPTVPMATVPMPTVVNTPAAANLPPPPLASL